MNHLGDYTVSGSGLCPWNGKYTSCFKESQFEITDKLILVS